jgi:hypothetical protein
MSQLCLGSGSLTRTLHGPPSQLQELHVSALSISFVANLIINDFIIKAQSYYYLIVGGQKVGVGDRSAILTLCIFPFGKDPLTYFSLIHYLGKYCSYYTSGSGLRQDPVR